MSTCVYLHLSPGCVYLRHCVPAQDLAKKDHARKVAAMREWNEEELRMLDKAVAKFPQVSLCMQVKGGGGGVGWGPGTFMQVAHASSVQEGLATCVHLLLNNPDARSNVAGALQWCLTIIRAGAQVQAGSGMPSKVM
jgi:hypothetical protein